MNLKLEKDLQINRKMSDAPVNKKRKYAGPNKKKIFNQQYKRHYLEPGFSGFMITCNFREKECVREGYTLLNEYADDWQNDEPATDAGDQTNDAIEKSTESNTDKSDDSDGDDEIEDISSQLENEIRDSIKAKKRPVQRFQQVDTGTPNCLFIKSTVGNPVGLTVKILRDLAETKIQKTRFLLRLLPVETVCRANVEDIKNAAGKLFDKYFLNGEPKTFSIIVNKRYNNNIDRMGIIRELADIVTFKNVAHKVCLGNPQFTIIVEVIKGLCCLSVVPDYLQLKKYNLAELAAKPKTDDNNKNGDKTADTPTTTTEPDSSTEIEATVQDESTATTTTTTDEKEKQNE